MSASKDSVFPEISHRLYEGLDLQVKLPQYPLGCRLLAGANEPFDYLGRFSGIGLSSVDQVRRVFLLHKLAFANELDGNYRRADFYWRALHRFFRLVRDPGRWQVVCNHYGTTLDSVFLRQAVAVEVIARTHAAFYRGIRGTSPIRAKIHFDHLVEIFDQAEVEPATAEKVLGPLLLDHASAAADAGNWDVAVVLGEELLKRFPETLCYRLTLARHCYANALTQLVGESHAVAHNGVLQRAILDIARLQTGAQGELSLMQYLADLHYLQALKLLKMVRPADALLAITKALHFNPRLQCAIDLQTRLRNDISALRAGVEALVASLDPGERLNSAGNDLKAQSDSGASTADEFAASEGATEILKRYSTLEALGGEELASEHPQCTVPALVPAPAASRQVDVPFNFWLWSGEDNWLKLEVVFAIVLLFGGAWFALREMSHRITREVAYRSLNQALERKDFSGAVDAAESFLGSRMVGHDTREPEVKRWYSESLVRWFAAQDSNSDQIQLHIRRYRSLVDSKESKSQ